MATYQTSYSDAFAIGTPGMIADSEPSNVISRTVEGADIPFGQPVLRGAGDHGCILASQETYQAAATITGLDTITASPTVSAGAKLGTYTATAISAGSTGKWNLEDPDGDFVGVVTTGSAFSAGGLAFTITHASTGSVVGDTASIVVTATTLTDVGDYLGISARVTTIGAEDDIYSAGDTAAILDRGVIWATAGATVTPADTVYWNPSTKRYTKTVTHLALPRVKFDTSAVDGGMVRLRCR